MTAPRVTRPITLDLDRPMRSLREAAGLRLAEAQVAIDGAYASAVTNPEQRGAGIKLATLLERARAYGLEVEIVVRKAR